MSDDVVIRLRVGGEEFDVDMETLLKVKNTYFHGLLSSGAWQPDADGFYSIDRPATGFDRILEYLSSGVLDDEGLSDSEKDCMYSNLDYFLIPYERQWAYETQSMFEDFFVYEFCELKDGRLCGASKTEVIIWSLDSAAIEMTMVGHTAGLQQVIQLHDGRVCTRSRDCTIKIWSIDSGLCELTITGDASCMTQLIDGRLCSGASHSRDNTINIWNVSTGTCEVTIDAIAVHSITQLADGRLCCGGSGGMYVYCLLTGECERRWRSERLVREVVGVDSTCICSWSDKDRSIRVWDAATGANNSLRGHSRQLCCVLLMHDGRLCSASVDGTLKIWNLESFECEISFKFTDDVETEYTRVWQLRDGRFFVCNVDKMSSEVWIWS